MLEGTPTDGLVIFDCDGVLVDSEPISVDVLRDVIAEAGGEIAEQQAYDWFLGRSMATVVDILKDEIGLTVSSGQLALLRARLYERFRHELKPVPGVVEVVKGLDRPCCVASSSQMERIQLSLEVTGLLDLFNPHIYSATMVKEGKPAPDLFLFAAASIGIEPSNCVVVEDSAAGIMAARRAGMQVFAYTGGSHAVPGRLREKAIELEPDAIFDDMRDLPDLLRESERPKKGD